MRETELIAYARVAAAKLAGLHLAYDGFRKRASAERRADFEAYRAEQGDALLRFACFEVLRRHHAPAPWTEWPQPWRSPEIADLHDFRFRHHDEVAFEEFVQWVADRQLAACKHMAHRHGMPVGLYVDLAVGIDRHGADAWTNHGAVLNGVSMGAPPDEFNPQRPGLGTGAAQSECGARSRLSRRAPVDARRDAPCRRHPARPRARPAARVHDPARPPGGSKAPMCGFRFVSC